MNVRDVERTDGSSGGWHASWLRRTAHLAQHGKVLLANQGGRSVKQLDPERIWWILPLMNLSTSMKLRGFEGVGWGYRMVENSSHVWRNETMGHLTISLSRKALFLVTLALSNFL